MSNFLDSSQDLSKERMGEIALAIMEVRLEEEGIPHFKTNETKRELQKVADRIGISMEDVVAFYRKLAVGALYNAFSFKV